MIYNLALYSDIVFKIKRCNESDTFVDRLGRRW